MKTSESGINLIKNFEGLALRAYKCPGGVMTIGYGHTKGVKAGDYITPEQAEALLINDLKTAESAVNNLCNECNLTQNEFDALVSLVFNIGAGYFKNSTLLKKLKSGDKQGAAKQFDFWVLSKGVKLPGLVRRRNAEKELFTK